VHEPQLPFVGQDAVDTANPLHVFPGESRCQLRELGPIEFQGVLGPFGRWLVGDIDLASDAIAKTMDEAHYNALPLKIDSLRFDLARFDGGSVARTPGDLGGFVCSRSIESIVSYPLLGQISANGVD
jgi:hypothetical protein